jgi:Mn2+/Fe2+ NRAMP family transporter
MAVIQEMCARIALVTGRGLAANIKSMYSRKVLHLCTILLFIANTLNIGADLGAMAKAVQLVTPAFGFTFLIIAIGVLGLLLQVFIPYQRYAHYLKWLAITLLAYVATGLIIHMDWGQLLRDGFIPNITFSKTEILLITGILGTTISPYLFFWETSQEVEEEIAHGKTTVRSRQGTTDEEVTRMRIDVWSGMFLSNLVMFFIIAVCATTLFAHGITNINTASDAALALRPLAGNGAFFLFALGIIGTGMLAIPVLAGSTSYAISESFGWKEGLYRKLNEARAFYGVIIISVIIGILINFIGIDPIKALIYSAIANGIIAPIILVCIVHMSGSKKLMGKYRNSSTGNIVGWIITIFMGLAAIGAVISLI